MKIGTGILLFCIGLLSWGCQKGQIACVSPPMPIRFVLADSAGNNLFDSTFSQDLSITYSDEGAFRVVSDAKVYDSFPTFNYVCISHEMMALSERGIKDFHVTYGGRIDDLFLDAERVRDGDCSHEEINAVKFNSEPVEQVNTNFGAAFILKRK
jgi:hypothetical protein